LSPLGECAGELVAYQRKGGGNKKLAVARRKVVVVGGMNRGVIGPSTALPMNGEST